MGVSKASFLVPSLLWLHSRRMLRTRCLSHDLLPSAKLARVRAGYGLSSVEDSPQARVELAVRLLAGTTAWSLQLLKAHDSKVARFAAVQEMASQGHQKKPKQ